jgi:carbon storage regulator CsrA
MITLARRLGDSIRIGNDIEVRIIRCTGSRVQLAIKAPSALKIWRVDRPKQAPALAHEPREGTGGEPV